MDAMPPCVAVAGGVLRRGVCRRLVVHKDALLYRYNGTFVVAVSMPIDC